MNILLVTMIYAVSTINNLDSLEMRFVITFDIFPSPVDVLNII
jgi:hypothetical protein